MNKALGTGLKDLLIQKSIVRPDEETAGEIERLRNRVRELEEGDGHRAEALFQKAVNSLKIGDFLGASGFFQAVLAFDPMHVKAMINLAVAYMELGYRDRAMGALVKAVAIDPENETAKRNLAILKESE